MDSWRRGELLRLLPGMYVPLHLWASLAPWERFRLSACGYALARPSAVFTGGTAAILHGLPLVSTPRTLEVRATSRGHRGTRTLVASHLSPAGAKSLRMLTPQTRGGLPLPPRVSLRWNALQVPGDVQSVEVPRGKDLGRTVAQVDGLPTVQLQLASGPVFRESVVPLDSLARRHGAWSWHWAEEDRGLLRTKAAAARFDRAWGFVDPRAESPGESLSRALIEELGFERPQLQQEFRDEAGGFVARTDFWWESVRATGEFDGVGKYDIDLHDNPAQRRASIRREQGRDRGLRALVRHQAHWTWADLMEPDRLAEELLRAGVPRRR